MTEPERIHVTFRKAVSDGNYGTEAAEASFDLDVEPGEANDAIMYWLSNMRAHVHAELALSPSSQVRRAVEPPKPRNPVPAEPDSEPDLIEIPF